MNLDYRQNDNTDSRYTNWGTGSRHSWYLIVQQQYPNTLNFESSRVTNFLKRRRLDGVFFVLLARGGEGGDAVVMFSTNSF